MHTRVIACTGHCEQSQKRKIDNTELKREISAPATIGGMITKLKLAAKACPRPPPGVTYLPRIRSNSMATSEAVHWFCHQNRLALDHTAIYSHLMSTSGYKEKVWEPGLYIKDSVLSG